MIFKGKFYKKEFYPKSRWSYDRYQSKSEKTQEAILWFTEGRITVWQLFASRSWGLEDISMPSFWYIRHEDSPFTAFLERVKVSILHWLDCQISEIFYAMEVLFLPNYSTDADKIRWYFMESFGDDIKRTVCKMKDASIARTDYRERRHKLLSFGKHLNRHSLKVKVEWLIRHSFASLSSCFILVWFKSDIT